MFAFLYTLIACCIVSPNTVNENHMVIASIVGTLMYCRVITLLVCTK